MLVWLLCPSVLIGCSAPRRTFQPPANPATLSDATFLHYFATVPTVTVEEGARATLLLLGPTSNWPTFDEQWSELRRRDATRDAWKVSQDDTLDKGTLAFMLMHVANIPRGVNDTLASVTAIGDRRYALKACMDAGVLPHGLPHDPVTGGELVTAIRRSEARARQSASK